MILPKFDTLKVTDSNYKKVYIQCMSILHENIDAKMFKSYVVRYAKDHAIEPRQAFLALEDWNYVTIGKVIYLETHKFPLSANTKKWLNNRIQEIIEEGKVAIKEKRNIEVSPIIEKSEKLLSPDDLATKIIQMVEHDKLVKDREAPVKLITIENANKHIGKIISILENHHKIYIDDHEKMLKSGVRYSTIVRRRNEFGRVLQQIKTLAESNG